ncbi:hypothetical protein PSN45_004793 [Yamadazyma tenuis]|uniref:A1 cistron-splicing factor AAR2 n=1 Tax=Candida tenuis (strain ATCC 10573 / BCRC 21748 / CBS 615 / JCM 9827 / NBRC 10315 / NRRL Y-1498 / VKM Y-70) TaxID=590646 RepID=G3B1M4_CANTC|nr:uncharacterized protein CANTEDRAFT_104306 [Yamadazyma tenuis ATCC 10573]EGV64483.1 hypothetical protein CANTEDRAFT_104306 [Yamadazyma tenuis ATCC 10573]WEJ97244.1 hypothetical protein PSN45_004793 [Yamadazyma tenuis]
MNKPPKTTVIFHGVPNDTTNWLVGIDTKFFTINQLLKGIKLIPDGIHFIHYSLPSIKSNDTNAATSSSIRYGRWIECDNSVTVLYWNSDLEKFDIVDDKNVPEALNYSKYTQNLGEIYSLTVAYPEDEAIWNGLISAIDLEIISDLVSLKSDSYSKEVNTITPSTEENTILSNQLKSKDPTRELDPNLISGSEIQFTILNFKQKRDNVSLEQISQDYLDKSWYLEETFGHDTDFVLGELQLSFVQFIILGNFCSGLQWLNTLKLLSMSKTFIVANKSFSLKFLRSFKLQLESIPAEYIGETISLNSAVDTKNFIGIMENFVKDVYPREMWGNDDCCGKMKVNGMVVDTWKKILLLIQQRFQLDLSNLENRKVDEDQFEVFDLKDYDENDEDVPAIVS